MHTFHEQMPARGCLMSLANFLHVHLQQKPNGVYIWPYLFEYWYRRLFHPVVFLYTSNEQCLLSSESWFYRPSLKLILYTLAAPKLTKNRVMTAALTSLRATASKTEQPPSSRHRMSTCSASAWHVPVLLHSCDIWGERSSLGAVFRKDWSFGIDAQGPSLIQVTEAA